MYSVLGPLHGSCPGTASPWELSKNSLCELSRYSLYTGAIQEQPLHGSCLDTASTERLSKSSIYTGTVQGQPLHGSCSGTASSRKFYFLYIFFQILYILYNTIFIPAVIQGWAQPRWMVTPAPGLHGGRGEEWLGENRTQDWNQQSPGENRTQDWTSTVQGTNHWATLHLCTKIVLEQPLQGSCPGKVCTCERIRNCLYMGAVQEQLFHGSCPWAASTRELTRNSLYMWAVQEQFTQPLHGAVQE